MEGLARCVNGRYGEIARRDLGNKVVAMTAERAESQLLSAEDYLAWEESQEQKHEYVGGMVYAMAGGTNAHAAIAANVLVSLGSQLRGKRCRPFSSDLKVRVRYPTHTRFYYPDAMIACSQAPGESVFHDEPTVLIEIASSSTRRTDEWEKREAYLSIPSLRAYLLLEQDRAAAVVWRRGEQEFARETYSSLEAVIPLPEIEAQLALAEVYEAVPFTQPAESSAERQPEPMVS
ncbi:MAG TPA: Uma2 family endonuclease [Chthoniobacteraceae bacterium]